MTTVDTPASLRPEDEKLGWLPSLGYGLQHILAMFGGVIAVPLIIGGAAGLTGAEKGLLVSCALFVSGLATLLQTLGVPYFGAQLPLVQGISFASVSTLLTVVLGKGGGHAGMQAAFGAILVSAIIGLIIAPFFSMVVRLFPAVVTGSIITIIGLSLMPVAAGWITGQAQVNGKDNPDFASVANIALAGFTLLVILVLMKIKVLSRVAILLGLVIGTIAAFIVGKGSTDSLSGASAFAFPKVFNFGAPTFAVGAIVSMTIVILVIMVETTADILAVGEVVGTQVDSRRVANGLRADMISSTVAPVFNSFPATAFAQNVGLVAISGIKSRFAVALGGGVLVVLGLSPWLAGVVNMIPQAVLGGAGIVLFGTVAASGIRSLSKVEYQGNNNLIIVATSIGFGLIPVVSTSFWENFPDWFATIFDSGISACAIMAVLLNLFFNVFLPDVPDDPSGVAAAPALRVRDDEIETLEQGGSV